MKQNSSSLPAFSRLSRTSGFLVAAMLFACQIVFSQLTVPAGNTYGFLDARPLSVDYTFERTASIYTAAELGMASGSTITGIRYYLQSTTFTQITPTKVYLSNVSGTSYTSTIYANVQPSSQPQYSGTLPSTTFVAGQWIYIPFTTPFTYTGNNIQVLVQTNAGNGPTESSVSKQFRWSLGPNNSTQNWNTWQTTFNNNQYGIPESGRPNIQFFYTTAGAAGNVSFDNTVFTASENTTANIIVNRNGGSTGAVSVNYATSNGTATAGVDYTAASGTLTWADGDMTPKTIAIPINADFVLDNAETVNLTLSNPVGTTIANGTTASLTITDVLPPMQGTYTVGVGGDYPSLTNAGGIFQQINTRIAGVSGPLTINIISDITGETGNIALNEIAGGHPVVIQPYGAPRTISGALSTTANLGLIRFDGADNITINGSLTGASAAGCQIGGEALLRQLTIVNNSVGNTAAVLFQSSTSGAYNDTVKNVTVVGGTVGSGYGIMFRVFPDSSSSPSLVNNQNCRVENCAVKKASVGIYSRGSTTSNPNTGLIITQNDISATGPERVSTNAVLIVYETNPQVTFNKVNIQNTTTDLSETIGLAIGTGQAYSQSVSSGGISGALIANNWITGVVSTVDLGGSTAGIAISGTAFGAPNIIRNNMISNISGLSQYTYHVAGIWVVGAVASETKLYNNTISLYGDRGSRTNQSCSYGIGITGIDPSVEIKNNIVSTTQIATGGGLLKTYALGTLSTTFNNLISDNNVFYSGGVQDGGFRSGSLSNNAGTSYATLAAWTSATGKDANSIEVQPVFNAPTDLHLVAGSNPLIDGIGTPLTSVTNDIDCQPRSATNPTPGADESNASGFAISAAAGSNGTISPSGTVIVNGGADQTYTITPNCGAVVSNVIVDGVSQGPITTYTFSNVTTNHYISAQFSSNTSAPTISASGATTFCQGGSVTLTSSSTSGNLWSNGATTQSITVSASGNYSVVVTNGTCSSPASATTTVTVNPLPTTPTISASGATTFCQGGSVTLTSSASTGNIWSNGATTQSITVSASGNYSVAVTNGTCSSPASATTTVTVNPLPTTPTISASGATTFCQGGSVVLTSSSPTGNVWSNGATTQAITVSASGNYSVVVTNGTCSSPASATTTVTVNPLPITPTISASGATTFCDGGSVTLTSSSSTGNLWSNGATTQSITVSTSGNYSVLVNNGTCASASSAATTVTVNPLPTMPTISTSGATTFCQGGSVTLTSSSATGNLWSNGATTQSITVSASGNYSVLVNNGTCASATSAATTVTVNPLPTTPTISASGATTFCDGGSVTLTSSASTGNIWSNGATTQSITVSASGNYSVLVNNGTCASGSSAATTVTVNPLPTTPTISASGATTFCDGGSVTLTSSSATGNIWSNGATTQSITVSASGNYSVLVNNGTCSSATSAATTVTVNPLPTTPTISASGATTFCDGGNVTLTSSSPIGNIWSNGATTQSITVSASGNYSVLVNNGTCASATSAATTVTVNPLPTTPTISASGATTFCDGGSVTLTSSSATGNIWSNGATTQSITVSTSGNYSVLVDNGICASASSAATTIVVNALPDAGVTQSGGIVTASQSGASYQWFTCANQEIANETSQNFIPTSIGDYYVVISNGDCTVSSDCISVTQLGTGDFTHNYFRIYPNPVTDVLNIEYTGALTKVELFNIAGQKLYSADANATATQIDMSSLPAGIYLVRAASEKASQTFKVVRK